MNYIKLRKKNLCVENISTLTLTKKYKTPFILANNVGIIDSGYRGNICTALYNTHSTPEVVEMGKRIAQICMPDLSFNFHVRLVKELSDTSRGSGGFGSTGH